MYCGCVCECTQYLLPHVEICQKTKHKSASNGTIGPRRVKIKIVQILHVWCVYVCMCGCVCVSVCKYGMGDCVLLSSDLTQCTCTVYCVHMRGVWVWAYCKDYMNKTSAMPSGVFKRIIFVYQITSLFLHVREQFVLHQNLCYFAR